MEWFKTIAPLIGVFIGWGLAEYGKTWVDKKSDRKKLNRLLFYLLELRYQIQKELSFEKEVTSFMKSLENKLTKEFGQEVKIGIEQTLPIIENIKSSIFGDDNQIEYLEQNIDNVIIELSEVFPIFAYELNGQHKIKDRLTKADQYLNQFDDLISQIPFDFKTWLQPKLSEDLLADLDKNIKKIADKLDNTTYNEVLLKLRVTNIQNDSQLNSLVDDYVSQIKNSMK